MDRSAGGSGQTSKIGDLRVYLVSLYSGTVLFILGLSRLYSGLGGSGTILTGLGSILLIVAGVTAFVRIFQIWRFVINVSPSLGLTPSMKTPGRAVGFLFIPFFNLYWVFIAIGKLPRDLNALALSLDMRPRIPSGLGIAIAIFTIVSMIPILGPLAGAVSGLILVPIFLSGTVRSCREAAGKIFAPGYAGAMEPVGWERKDVRYFPDLLDPERFGIRFGAVFAFPAANLSVLLLHFFGMAPFGFFSHRFFLKLALGQIILGLLTGILFVAAGSLIRKAWALPAVWGLLGVPLGYAGRFIHIHFRPTVENQELTRVAIDPFIMLNNFLWAFFFMGVLVLAVRFWGLRPWSLPAGLVAIQVLFSLPQWIMRPHTIFQYGFHSLLPHILPILTMVLLGLFLYFALLPPLVMKRSRTILEN